MICKSVVSRRNVFFLFNQFCSVFILRDALLLRECHKTLSNLKFGPWSGRGLAMLQMRMRIFSLFCPNAYARMDHMEEKSIRQ